MLLPGWAGVSHPDRPVIVWSGWEALYPAEITTLISSVSPSIFESHPARSVAACRLRGTGRLRILMV